MVQDGGTLHEVGVLQALGTDGALEVAARLRALVTGAAPLRPRAAVPAGVTVSPARGSPPRFSWQVERHLLK